MTRGIPIRTAGRKKTTDYKESVKVATTAVIANLSSVDVATGIDDVALVEGDRVGVIHNASPDGVIAQHAKYKGIYVVGVVAGGLAALTRAEDFDTDEDVTDGAVFFVEQGTVNGGKTFVLTTNNPIALGTTSLNFADSLAALASYQLLSQKGQANGYAELDGAGKVPAGQLPPLGLDESWLYVANVTGHLIDFDPQGKRKVYIAAMDADYDLLSILNTKEGQFIEFFNASDKILTVRHQDSGGTAGLRINTRQTPAADVPIAAGEIAQFEYADAESDWILGSAIGEGGGTGGDLGIAVGDPAYSGRTVNANTWTALAMASVSYETQSGEFFDLGSFNTRIKIPDDGVYTISGYVAYLKAQGTEFHIAYRKNGGVAIRQIAGVPACGTAFFVPSLPFTVAIPDLVAGDYIEIVVYSRTDAITIYKHEVAIEKKAAQ